LNGIVQKLSTVECKEVRSAITATTTTAITPPAVAGNDDRPAVRRSRKRSRTKRDGSDGKSQRDSILFDTVDSTDPEWTQGCDAQEYQLYPNRKKRSRVECKAKTDSHAENDNENSPEPERDRNPKLDPVVSIVSAEVPIPVRITGKKNKHSGKTGNPFHCC
jgi:hypothetical protein